MKVEIAGDEQMKDKKNKVAVVTGGSSGIGRSTKLLPRKGQK